MAWQVASCMTSALNRGRNTDTTPTNRRAIVELSDLAGATTLAYPGDRKELVRLTPWLSPCRAPSEPSRGGCKDSFADVGPEQVSGAASSPDCLGSGSAGSRDRLLSWPDGRDPRVGCCHHTSGTILASVATSRLRVGLSDVSKYLYQGKRDSWAPVRTDLILIPCASVSPDCALAEVGRLDPKKYLSFGCFRPRPPAAVIPQFDGSFAFCGLRCERAGMSTRRPLFPCSSHLHRPPCSVSAV